MEIEKQYKGLVLVACLVGCVQLQAAEGGGWGLDACAETGDMAAGGRPQGMPVSQFPIDNSSNSDDVLGQSQSTFMCKEGMVIAADARKSQSPTSASSAALASSFFPPNQNKGDAVEQQQGQQDKSQSQPQYQRYAGFDTDTKEEQHDHQTGSCGCGHFLLRNNQYSQVYLSCTHSDTPCDCLGSDHTLGSQSSVGSSLEAALMASGADSPTKYAFDNPAYTTRGSSAEMVAPASSGADSVQGKQQASGDVVAAAAELLNAQQPQNTRSFFCGGVGQEQLQSVLDQQMEILVQLKLLQSKAEKNDKKIQEDALLIEEQKKLLVQQEQKIAVLQSAIKGFEELKEKAHGLQDLFLQANDANNESHASREEQVKALKDAFTELQEQVAQLQAAQKSQSQLLNVTQQSRQFAARNLRRRGLMRVFGFCMNHQPEHDRDQTPPHQMDSLHNLSAATDLSKSEGPGTLARTSSRRSTNSQVSEV